LPIIRRMSRFWAAVYLGEAGRGGSLDGLVRAREIENMEWVKREIDIAAARLATTRKRQREREEDERLGRIITDSSREKPVIDPPEKAEAR